MLLKHSKNGCHFILWHTRWNRHERVAASTKVKFVLQSTDNFADFSSTDVALYCRCDADASNNRFNDQSYTVEHVMWCSVTGLLCTYFPVDRRRHYMYCMKNLICISAGTDTQSVVDCSLIRLSAQPTDTHSWYCCVKWSWGKTYHKTNWGRTLKKEPQPVIKCDKNMKRHTVGFGEKTSHHTENFVLFENDTSWCFIWIVK